MMLKLLPVPHLVFHVNDLGGDSIGRANAFVIRLANDKESNYKHEVEHVKQFYMTLGLHGLLYKFIKPYRLWAEVKAYKKSIQYGRGLDSAVNGLLNKSYGFGLTYMEAEKLLKG